MRFNTNTPTTADEPTTNRAGGPAYAPTDPRLQLWSLVTANLIEDSYYRGDDEALAEVRSAFDACADVDPAFVLQLAAYVREELYQRDIAQVLLVLAANDERFHGRANPADASSPSLIRAYAPTIVQRADEPATCLAIQRQLFPGRDTVPKPLKNALSDALGQFDAYQLAKYRQNTRDWSLRDVLNVVRPDPSAADWFGGDADEQRERYARLIEGGMDDRDREPLPTPETWEDELSNFPNSAKQAFTLASHRTNSDSYVMLSVAVPGAMDGQEPHVTARFDQQPGRDGVTVAVDGLGAAPAGTEATVTVEQTERGGDAVSKTVTAADMEEWSDVAELTFTGPHYGESEAVARLSVTNPRVAYASVLPKMGLFATVRNLRNMRQAGLTGDDIFDAEAGVNDSPPTMADVRRSKVYPFRFYQAYKALAGPDAADAGRRRIGRTRVDVADESLLDATTREWLTDAMAVAVENVPAAFRDDTTFVAVDMSGSMGHPVSDGSAFTQRELGAFFGAALGASGDRVATGVFGDDFKRVPHNPAESIPERVETLMRAGAQVGNSTNGYKALDHLTTRWHGEGAEAFDRIVIVTDCQLWDSTPGVRGSQRTVEDAYGAYTDALAARGIDRPALYILDVDSYGDLVLPSDHPDVVHISGWSERVLDFIDAHEQAHDVVRERIRSIEPRGLTARGRDPEVAFDG